MYCIIMVYIVLGLPNTHEITSLPPCIFNLNSVEHFMEFGGEPLHVIFSPNSKNDFCISTLSTGALVCCV